MAAMQRPHNASEFSHDMYVIREIDTIGVLLCFMSRAIQWNCVLSYPADLLHNYRQNPIWPRCSVFITLLTLYIYWRNWWCWSLSIFHGRRNAVNHLRWRETLISQFKRQLKTRIFSLIFSIFGVFLERLWICIHTDRFYIMWFFTYLPTYRTYFYWRVVPTLTIFFDTCICQRLISTNNFVLRPTKFHQGIPYLLAYKPTP